MKQVASFGWGQKGKEKKRKERKKKKAKRLSQRRRIQKEQKEKERGKGMERKKVLAVHQEWKCVQQTNKATTNVSDEKKKKKGGGRGHVRRVALQEAGKKGNVKQL